VSFQKLDILFEFTEGENFNPPECGGGLKFEPDKEIGQDSNLWMGTS